ncbi:HAD-IA family hydrolase [bacterium]|nr:HAD-IA family hydrolase [bacterium]
MLDPKGILFDLDGTLIDTSHDIAANLNRAFESMSYPQLPYAIIMSHVGYGAHYLVEHCLQTHQPDIKVDDQLVTKIWEQFRAFYRLHIVDEAQPYPGVTQFLEQEQRPMGVISNKPEEFVKAVLRELDHLKYFKFSWGRDSLPVSKPDPEIIRYGVYELGFDDPGDVCMVGDNEVDLIAAKGAGSISVGMTYGFSAAHLIEKEAPDYLFHNFIDFSRAVQNSSRENIP